MVTKRQKKIMWIVVIVLVLIGAGVGIAAALGAFKKSGSSKSGKVNGGGGGNGGHKDPPQTMDSLKKKLAEEANSCDHPAEYADCAVDKGVAKFGFDRMSSLILHPRMGTPEEQAFFTQLLTDCKCNNGGGSTGTCNLDLKEGDVWMVAKSTGGGVPLYGYDSVTYSEVLKNNQRTCLTQGYFQWGLSIFCVSPNPQSATGFDLVNMDQYGVWPQASFPPTPYKNFQKGAVVPKDGTQFQQFISEPDKDGVSLLLLCPMS